MRTIMAAHLRPVLLQLRSRSITCSLRCASMLALALSNLHPVCNAPIVNPQRKPMKETLSPSEHHATTSFRGEETQTYLYIRMDWVTIWYSWRVKLQRAWLVVTSILVFSGTIRIVEFCTRCKVQELLVLGRNDVESWHNGDVFSTHWWFVV